MDYSTILTKFRSCMEDIGNALRTVLGTSQKYKFTEVAAAINSCNQVYYLGTGTSFDVSGIPGYQNLTADNFIVATTSGVATGSTYEVTRSVTTNIQKSYNSQTGRLTVSGTSNSADNNSHPWYHVSISITVMVYLVIGKIKTL